MSVRTHRGFTFTAPGLDAPLSLMGAQSGWIQEMVDAEHRQVLADAVCAGMDARSLAHAGIAHPDNEGVPDLERFESPLFSAFCAVDAARANARSSFSRDSNVDCDVEVALWVLPATRQLLGRVSQARTPAYARLLETEGVQEFSYYNSTERPAQVDAASWDARAHAWSATLDKSEVIHLSMKWVAGPCAAQDLKAHYGSAVERASRIAEELVLGQYVKHERIERPRMSDFRLKNEGREQLGVAGSGLAQRLGTERDRVASVLFSAAELLEYAGLPLNDIPWRRVARQALASVPVARAVA
jgi:hypothetical protein